VAGQIADELNEIDELLDHARSRGMKSEVFSAGFRTMLNSVNQQLSHVTNSEYLDTYYRVNEAFALYNAEPAPAKVVRIANEFVLYKASALQHAPSA
jgi:hypothetical protein